MAGLALALLGLHGCGSDEDGEVEKPSRAAQECREEWSALGTEIADREDRSHPSALAQRWSSISAAVDHYRSAAEGSDCDKTLAAEKKAVAALAAFSGRLARFDMELRLAQIGDDAKRYASRPRPPAPEQDPKKKQKGDKPAQPERPPKPAAVAAALATLTRQAPLATEQQAPGWQQARAVDLADAKATRKAVKDLEFLSEESAAYGRATAALGTIRRALAATQE